MAQAFKRVASRGVAATATTLGGYTVAAGVAVTVIGLSVANTSTVPGTVDLYVQNASGIVGFIVKGAPLPVAGALVAVGGDQKLVLQAGDFISVAVNGGAAADALMSLLELS